MGLMSTTDNAPPPAEKPAPPADDTRLRQGVETTLLAWVRTGMALMGFGFVVARLARSYFLDVKMPGALPVVLSAFVLLAAAVVASMLPAARAARVDVIQALRSE